MKMLVSMAFPGMVASRFSTGRGFLWNWATGNGYRIFLFHGLGDMTCLWQRIYGG